MSHGFLLDTNVVSELSRPRPSPAVVRFVASLHEISIPSVVAFELERGVQRLPTGRRRRDLERWLAPWLEPPVHVLPFDAACATAAAEIEVPARKRGRPIATHDLFVLAIARVHDLCVATRDVGDFDGHGVEVFDPFAG